MPSPPAPAPVPGDPLTPEQARVLASAVAEYRAGHKSDLAAARKLPVPYTQQDRDAYSRALQEHYTAVRALIRTTNQAKEPADVRP